MRIKRLEIFGFKSFKDRTVIQFDEGITGVVGPNGCGKSNIVDALVWVMGEMSAKHLRGSSMEDVIFAGAEGYAPMGMAEVHLTLENDGGPFPAQYMRFSELMITRKLHRSGESEYLINKEPARLRDIQEIFMDTGAGSKGFSIIEQGAIGKIITAKPDDRRVLIEEAAGITKFKVRKRESQRKLDATDQNLVRLQDIIGEQKRQIDSLERQAQRAERYRKIKNELQEKDLWLSAQNYLKLREESQAAEIIFSESRDLDAGSEGKLAEFETKISAARLELAEKESAVQVKQTQYRELLNSVQDTELKIKELNLSIEQARRSSDMTGSILSQYTLRKLNLENEKESIETKLIESREEALRLESEFNEKNTAYLALQQQITNYDNELTTKRREMLAISTSLSQLEARDGVVRSKIEGEEKNLQQVQALANEIKAKKTEFEERRNRLFSEFENARQMHLDVTKDVELIAGNLENVRQQSAQRKSELEGFKDILNMTTSRLYGLENLQSNFEGFEEGVKNVMMWQRSKSENTKSENDSRFQPLAEVVEVPERYEMAMEASLGTRLQLLLGDSSNQILGAVDYLKTQKNGRSSFLSGDMAVDIVSYEHSNAQLSSEEGFDTFLKDVVRIPDNIKPHVAQFFSGVVVVDSVRTALRLRSVYPDRTFVTVEGDALSRDGVLTGGAVENAESGVLRRRREIKELSLKREEMSGKVQLAQLAVTKLQEQEHGVLAQLEEAKKTAVEREISSTELRKDLERAEQELKSASQTYEKEKQKSAAIQEQIEKLQVSLEELSQQTGTFAERKTELDTSTEKLTTELEQSEVRIRTQSTVVTDLKVKFASKTQEVDGLTRELSLVQATLSDVVSQLSQMTEEKERNVSTLTTGQVAVENLQIELQKIIHLTQEAERSLALQRDEFEKFQAQTRDFEDELSKTMHSLNQTRARMNEAQLKLEQIKMKELYITEQVQERYMQNLADIAFQYKDQVGDVDTFTKDVADLRDKLKRIGEVNLSAIQEYDEVITRYEFLNQQYKDLLEAKEHLRKVIERINRICSRRFKDTFEQVNDRFQKVFPVLFGGGEAMLVLVDGKDAADPGIEIVARPPGKKMQNVTLLSGGEKALTAVSLIFAIFLVKPSPFCLLDEVDAPLDDANVMRFNDLVKEMAKRSQIIVVTHNKHTMKVNNKLYGVTMQEKGVSKMVSVSLADAEKLAQS